MNRFFKASLTQNNPKYSKVGLNNHMSPVKNIRTLSVIYVANPVLGYIIQCMVYCIVCLIIKHMLPREKYSMSYFCDDKYLVL